MTLGPFGPAARTAACAGTLGCPVVIAHHPERPLAVDRHRVAVELRVDPPVTVMVMRQRQPLDRGATRGFPLARLTAVRAHGRSTIDQHLGRARIRTGRFVDQLLGTASHLVISRRGNAGRFLGRGPRGLADWPFLNRLCTGGLPRPTS